MRHAATILSAAGLSACVGLALPFGALHFAFDGAAIRNRGLTYDDGRLESLDPKKGRKVTDGNGNHRIESPRPGVLRLSGTGGCDPPSPDKPGLCFLRAEIRENPRARVRFERSTYYAISIDLANAGTGAMNDRGPPGEERLMIAQAKVGLEEGGNKSGVVDFSPILALRFEDDQLYVTTELTGGRAAPMPSNGVCASGLPAFKTGRNRDKPNAPYRVLLAMEADDDPAGLPWEFTLERNPNLVCLLGMKAAGERVFPRQPRDRPFRIALHIDGRLPDDAHVSVYIGNRFVACAASDIARRVVAEEHYFKFGLYGDLSRGVRLSADYSGYMRGPTAESVGLLRDRREDGVCGV